LFKMKSFNLLALAGAAQAHYVFPSMTYAGATTAAWTAVRQWTGYYTNDPVTSVTTLDIRCNVDGSTAFAPNVLTVAAGKTLGFTVTPDIYHAGPVLAYMAKVPSGYTASNWDGAGAVWFKVFAQGPTYTSAALVWPSADVTEVDFTIPADTPSGDYLFRVEHIAVHTAGSVGGAQFYLSCGQITVTGGGSGTPGPLVAFPGAYSPTDPGILINIYYPVPTTYIMPGPAIWTGGAGGSAPAPPTSTKSTTPVTTMSTSTVKTSAAPVPTTKSTTTPVSSGGTVAKYGQCGGQGWTGATVCASGSTCTSSSQFYSQCL